MEQKTKVLPRRKYDANFKAEILKMVANGQPVPYVSKALGVSENLIYRWKSQTKGKKKVELENDSSLLSIENQQLKERVQQLEIEREIWDPMLTHVAGPKKPYPFSAVRPNSAL